MTEELSQDEVFEILSNSRRRYLLRYLRSTMGPTDISEIVEVVAAREYDTGPDAVTEPQRKRIYVSLHQTHIPKLADMGVITHDKDAGVVELTDRAATIESYLSSPEQNERRWQPYYLGLAGIGIVLLLFDVLSIPPFGATPGPLLGLAIVLAFGLLAVAHYLTSVPATELAWNTP